MMTDFASRNTDLVRMSVLFEIIFVIYMIGLVYLLRAAQLVKSVGEFSRQIIILYHGSGEDVSLGLYR